eukprot:TRINITY_DN12693_c0_g1_i1.p1 TRINITY_DN12693_c0_g1~~TRINITY_DN12693_c0_g1_i1.p1  ORF type:complete len:262 (+),score=66.45 TRINITY_DN12693_c0_g1_i1:128-913(+)
MFPIDSDMVSDILGSTYVENGHTYEFCIRNLFIDSRVLDRKRSKSTPAPLLRTEAFDTAPSDGVEEPVEEEQLCETQAKVDKEDRSTDDGDAGEQTPDEGNQESNGEQLTNEETTESESTLLAGSQENGSVVETTETEDREPTRPSEHADAQEESGSDMEQVVTWMVRNLPCKVTQNAMEAELIKKGFHGTYDYVYCPTRKNGSGLGFGFVNFVKPEHACRFKKAFDGYAFADTRSAKRCFVTPADLQGLEANLRQFRRYA